MPYLGNTPSTSFATVVKDTFNGGSTAYTLSKVATTNSVSVFVENVRQEPTSAYSVSGTTLTFTATTPSGTGNIYVLHMNPTTTTTHPAAQNLTAVDGTFTGNIDVDGTANLDVVDIDGAVDMATTLAVAGNVDFNGDLDVDGTTNLDAVDIDGAVDMASTLAIAGDTTLSRAETDGTVRLNLSNTGSNGSSEYSEIKFNSTAGSTVTSIVQHRNNYGMNIGTTTDHPVSILQNNTAALTVTTDGDIDIESNNIFFSTAGKGIFLGATSKVDANKLDDYEEGTFTPSISVASGSVTLKSGYDLMSYTKIGNLVNIRGRIETDSVSSPSGTATLTGLPFTSSNSLSERSGRSGGQVLHDTFSGLGGGSVSYQMSENTTTLVLYEQFANGVGSLGDNFQTNSLIVFDFSYPAA